MSEDNRAQAATVARGAATRDAVKAYIEQTHNDTVLGELGMRFTNLEPDNVTVEVPVTKRLFRHGGVVHGGIFVLLGESVASTMAALNVDMSRSDVAGMEVNANHLRPVSEGTLTCSCESLHQGRTSHVYSYVVRDDKGRNVSVGRCTVSIRQRVI